MRDTVIRIEYRDDSATEKVDVESFYNRNGCLYLCNRFSADGNRVIPLDRIKEYRVMN